MGRSCHWIFRYPVTRDEEARDEIDILPWGRDCYAKGMKLLKKLLIRTDASYVLLAAIYRKIVVLDLQNFLRSLSQPLDQRCWRVYARPGGQGREVHGQKIAVTRNRERAAETGLKANGMAPGRKYLH